MAELCSGCDGLAIGPVLPNVGVSLKDRPGCGHEGEITRLKAELADWQVGAHADATGHLYRCAKVNGVWHCAEGCPMGKIATLKALGKRMCTALGISTDQEGDMLVMACAKLKAQVAAENRGIIPSGYELVTCDLRPAMVALAEENDTLRVQLAAREARERTLWELVEAQEKLLVAYRLGDNRRACAALDRIEKAKHSLAAKEKR